ncbi:hypothetical protein [Hymenobacter lapidiphilus]|uniref:Uncharacterized protein n=1 Tax=Hymenobacter lapidiphilus TaxID=2608003 RepID=A0A7Y7PSH4_9BACT|nr:hypothetical protein [Hymenobacter lapidiphilus]NVO33218.1 hypothetical protein [Hymenobacter lapidiphilus]
MSEPIKLPGISRLSEAELRDQYKAELGHDPAADLDTVAALKQAIYTHRGEPEATPAPEAPSAPAPEVAKPAEAPAPQAEATAGTVLADHPELGQRAFSAGTWALLGADTMGWKQHVPKPKDL